MADRDYDVLFKVLLIGDANVGKTSLLSRFVGNDFAESYTSTIGVDFKVQTLEIEERIIKLQIWDTGGQERFAPLVRSYFRGGQGVAIVYDVAQRQSFERVRHWVDMVKEHASDDVEMMIIGNKSDLENREVTSQEAQELALELEALWIETSAKSKENVEEAFTQLARKISQHGRSFTGRVYGPPPVQTYGPPVDLRGTPLRRGCCHYLGPPGNAYHEGSHVDRGAIMRRSMELKEIPSLPAAAPGAASTLAAALYAGRPLLLRGLAGLEDWAPRLAPAALLERFGERRVPVAQLRQGRSVPPFRQRSMTLKRFFEQMQRPETRKDVYLQQLPVQQHLPELEALGLPLDGPEILQKALGSSAFVTCTLFCGAGGIRTSLHFDRGDWAEEGQEAKSSIDNLFLQLSGRKRFRLFRPGDHDCLYARGALDPGAPHVSQIEDTSAGADLMDRFPRFAAAAARSFAVELGPGDALLLPRWWWHETCALSDGHAVNWWFEPRPKQ